MSRITLNFLVSVMFPALFFSCVSTVDIEKNVKAQADFSDAQLRAENENLKKALEIYNKKEEYYYNVEPELIPVTKYVVVNGNEIKDERPEGKAAVKASLSESMVKLKDYVGGTSYFDYDENSQFPVFTKILSMTTIILNDDEYMEGDSSIYLSDSIRWVVSGDIWQTDKGTRQILMVKPKTTGLETNMLVVTNKRLYHFVLYSTSKDYQPMVRFNYPLERSFVTAHTKKAKPSDVVNYFETLDMSKVSFNYKVFVPFSSRKVEWIPETVYDDGSHTYIILPEVNLQKEFPAVWENGREITNFEVHPEIHNMIVINKLVNKVTIGIGRKKIVIKKLRGKSQDFSYVTKKARNTEKKEKPVHVNEDVKDSLVDNFNFNYKVFLEKNQKKELWCPVKVYDDTQNLYVGFNDGILESHDLSFYDGNNQIEDWIYRGDVVVFNEIPKNLRIVCGEKYVKVQRYNGSSNVRR